MVAAAGRMGEGALGRALARAAAETQPGRLGKLVLDAFEREWDERRFFLWVPVGAGAGVALYFSADQEPSLLYAAAVTAAFLALAFALRTTRRGLVLAGAAAAVAAGFTGATLRTAALQHPLLDRIRIVSVTGTIEDVDLRRNGARFVLRIADGSDASGLGRVRLTTRRNDPIAAGDTVHLTARLVPPAPASLPGGYSFARDAYFLGFDAVGSVVGRISQQPIGDRPGLGLRVRAAIDRTRNALATRVSQILEGDVGAIAAAMVTGKRDLLSDDGRELIREAGIFHIITIAGVQMTLVAGLLFAGFRAILAAIPTLALRYPIKAWAAAGAMAGAIAYDILTGSRIGTQRALVMTLIMLGAVLAERRAFTMRNLALAALIVVVLEPEAVLGASFQLSFAAVAALVAVQEGRGRKLRLQGDAGWAARAGLGALGHAVERLADLIRHAGRLLVATVAATSATAPVMASNFHEISPYVVIGNPLTLSIIEFFAIPGALLGSLLYPLGLDRFVWHWLGWGIELVLWAARLIASAPGASLAVPAFAPWALACFALATCSAVLWRTTVLRLSAIPLFLLGLVGAFAGTRYDLIVAPTGDSAAFPTEAGSFAIAGRVNVFGAAQWLSADGDGRPPDLVGVLGAKALRCDASACIAALPGGKTMSVVAKADAFEEDCRRADIVVTPLFAPASCGAELIVDRGTLAGTGALAFTVQNGGYRPVPARASGEHRPWSQAATSVARAPERRVQAPDAAGDPGEPEAP